ncbi:hypothetical protein ABZS88_37015 [Streptomyces sp. NPDC005480]|uniref:hypothetical protein n=1 Tax=Streptomyces sp. NPDC005480 TaxID=3154880 RepID=UPI0033B165C6
MSVNGPVRRNSGMSLEVSHVDEHVHLVHTGGRPPEWLTGIADRLSPALPGEAVVLVGAPPPENGADGLCQLFAPTLEADRNAHIRLLLLVMTAGADASAGHASVARQICER